MTMSFAPRPSFEYLPHVGELGIRLRGGSIAEVLRQAALALAELLLPGRPPPGPERVYEIVLDAPDRAALLIDWLNELLFLAERDRWVPSRIDSLDATELHLSATARGPVLDRAPSLVKAATWHGLRFDVRDGGFEAEVLLDV
jgi:SHS2 domain-containing protein